MFVRRLIPLLFLCTTLAAEVPGAEFFEPVQPPRPFQVMVHRGAMLQAPENTAPALERCIEEGFEWAEVDVRLTRDGKHVVFHDDNVDGKTNGAGRVQDLTLAELKALDGGSWFSSRFAGEHLLTLSECLRLAKGRLNLYLDCKAVDPALLVEEILAEGMDSQVAVYDALEVLARVRDISRGRVPIMAKWHPEFGMDEWIARWHPDAVEINADEVTADICARFHQAGIKVQAKVLAEADSPEIWTRMRDSGVDWFQTDRAEEVIARLTWMGKVNRPVQISHHRAANYYAPENTLASYDKSLRLGADYVEFDVRTAADGSFHILHDENLDRTTDGAGPITAFEAAALEKLSAQANTGKPFAGEKIPTLDETFKVLGGKTMLYVDAKAITPEDLARELQRSGQVERSVVYQSPDYLIQLKAIDPAIRALCPLYEVAQLDALAASVHPFGFDVSWRLLSEELIRHCHDLGIQVFSDSVDDFERIEDYQQAIAWGIDVIQTDVPLRVMRAVALMEKPALTSK